MSDGMTGGPDESVRYFEEGASWWGLLFGPIFGLLGAGAEALTGGPVQVWVWTVVAAVLVAFTALWIHARRTYCRIRLTKSTFTEGAETLPIESIAEVVDGDPPIGARVLGGGFSAPRKYHEVPLRLEDGSVVVAWARDGEALRSALYEVVAR